MIKKYDKKCTAKQLAAKIIDDSIEVGLEFWGEKMFVNYKDMSDKERQSVDRQLDAYAKRIKKILAKGLCN